MDLNLTEKDQHALLNKEWLSDKHMSASAKILKTQFTEVRGFQPTVTGRFVLAMSNSYQFHHYGNHWCVSWLKDGVVTLCDSLLSVQSQLPEPLCIQLQHLYGHHTTSVQCRSKGVVWTVAALLLPLQCLLHLVKIQPVTFMNRQRWGTILPFVLSRDFLFPFLAR